MKDFPAMIGYSAFFISLFEGYFTQNFFLLGLFDGLGHSWWVEILYYGN